MDRAKSFENPTSHQTEVCFKFFVIIFYRNCIEFGDNNFEYNNRQWPTTVCWILDALKNVLTHERKVRNTKQIWVFLIFYWVCQNISNFLKLNRPRLRSYNVIYWVLNHSDWPIRLLDFNQPCSSACLTLKQNFRCWTVKVVPIKAHQIQKDEQQYQPVFQKKTPDNIFIVKFKNFTPGVKILEFKSNRRHQDFPKSKIYTNHSNQNIFGGG